MFIRYANWISHKYAKANKGRFLAFLNIISISGVAIGVMALIIVIGVMTGFGNNLRDKIIGVNPHIMIEKETGIANYKTTINQVRAIDGVQAVSPYVQSNVFLESSEKAVSLVMRGVSLSSEEQITKVSQYLDKGTFQDLDDDSIIIGRELARFFGYHIGDKVTLISPGSGMSGQGWRYELTVSGIFYSGMADYDMSLVLVSLSKAQQILDYPEGLVSGIGVKIDNPKDAKDIKMAIYDKIGFGFLVRSWEDLNRNLFEALFLEKWGLFIILTLMVIVASFNIISTLIVTVTSKVHDIGILRSVGVSKKAIRKIFINQGMRIGALGTVWGSILGVVICYLLKTYFPVPSEIYFIEHVPVDLQAFDMTVIVLSALLITFLATIYPAIKASNLQPVDALRYE